MALGVAGSNPATHPISILESRWDVAKSVKAPDFDSGIRRFESCHPSQYDPLAQ